MARLCAVASFAPGVSCKRPVRLRRVCAGPGAGGAGAVGAVPVPRGAAMHTSLPSERTGIIGTSWYIAPEIVDGWASYDEKARLTLAQP